jgi:hypothetical protein
MAGSRGSLLGKRKFGSYKEHIVIKEAIVKRNRQNRVQTLRASAVLRDLCAKLYRLAKKQLSQGMVRAEVAEDVKKAECLGVIAPVNATPIAL